MNVIHCRTCKKPLRRGEDKIVRERCSTCYERFRRRERIRGRWEGLVSASSVRAHIRELHGAGMAFTTIARAAGLGERYIRDLLRGKYKRVLPSTERVILAIELEHSPGRRMSALGARRRLQGLYALGYDFNDLAREVPLGITTVYRVANGQSENIWRTVHDRIAEAYAKLQIEPGPSERARRIARRRGWVSAWAWDDWALDDPNAEPHADGAPIEVDEVLLLRIMSGRNFKLPSGSKMAYARALIARGWTVADVDKVMRFSSRQLRELRQIYNSTKETE